MQGDELKLNAKKVSLVYVVLASVYILISDLLTSSLSADIQSSIYIQSAKGLLFVCITGGLLYLLLARYSKKLKGQQQELEESENKVFEQRQLFNAIINQTEAIIYVKDAESRVLMVNDAYLRLFDIDRDDIVGKKEKVIYDEPLLDQIKRNDREVLQGGKPKEFEEAIEVNGEIKYYQTIKYPLEGVPNFEGCICGISTDITEQKQTMNKLRERTKEQACLYKISDLSEKDYSIKELLNRAVSCMPDGWQHPDITEAKITFEGQEFTTEGFSPSEHSLSVVNSDIEGKPLEVEVVYIDEKGRFDTNPFLKEEQELIQAIAATLTTKIDRILTFKKLQSSLEEKEVLLQEIHHRVKNNLAVVSGLLQLQRFKLDDTVQTDILKNSEMRIQTMGLVHEKLYQSSSLSSIDFGSYIDDLIQTLQNTISFSDGIDISIECDPIELNINQAIPSALILNELITNAGKHAFPDGEGRIDVVIKEENNNKVTVSVSDNGVGIPDDIDVTQGESMGYMIVNTLIRQLSADMEVTSSEEGTAITFEFTKKALKGSSSNIE